MATTAQWRSRESTAILLIAILANIASAQLPVIELGAISPAGTKAGSEVDLRISSGVHTEEVDRLRFSHPGITAEVTTEDPLPFTKDRRIRFGHFNVRVAADVPPGCYEIRAIGRHGVSNPRSFIIHNVPSVRHLTASHSRAAPTELAIDTVVYSKATASEIDYYQLKVAAGQALQVDLLAVDLDSRMIGQMELIDSRGKIVQSVYGSDELDPSMSITANTNESFTLAISDAIFRGGEEYAYQLVMRESDHAESFVRKNAAQQRFTRSIGDYSDVVKQAIEIEDTSDAKTITLPCMITSEFDSPDDVDQYLFTANEGDQYTIDLVSQRLGQPTDARILIERAEEQQAGDPVWIHVAMEDDSQNVSDAVMRLNSNDPVLAFKAPKSTTYRLSVHDLDTGTTLSKRQRYWIDIREPNPAVDLIAYQYYPSRDANQAHQCGSNLFRSGIESLRVFAIRRDGWTGPIELSVAALPEGVTCPPVTMAADKNEVQMTLIASNTAAQSVASLQVIGNATIDGKKTAIQSKFATTLWGRGGQREFHRLRTTADLVIAVSDQDVVPIAFAIGEGKVVELKKGGVLKLPITLTRLATAKNECIVRPRDLPPNVTAGEVKIPGDKTDGELKLKANGNAKAGTYSLWLESETKIKHRANPQSLERAKAYRDELQKLYDDPASKDKLEAIKAAIVTADANVGSAKGSATDRDLTVFLPSPSLTVRIVE